MKMTAEERRERSRTWNKRYRETHREKVKAGRSRRAARRAAPSEKERETERLRLRAYYLRNAAKVKAASKAWKKANPEKARASAAACGKRRAPRDPAEQTARKARWRARHPEQAKLESARSHRKRVEEISPSYAAQLFCEGSSLKPSAIPAGLVDLQRAQLQLRRLCKTLKTSKP